MFGIGPVLPEPAAVVSNRDRHAGSNGLDVGNLARARKQFRRCRTKQNRREAGLSAGDSSAAKPKQFNEPDSASGFLQTAGEAEQADQGSAQQRQRVGSVRDACAGLHVRKGEVNVVEAGGSFRISEEIFKVHQSNAIEDR